MLCFCCGRYLLRVTMTGKGMVSDTKKDAPFWVRNYDTPPDEAPPIKMEVRVVHSTRVLCCKHVVVADR
jgi:hypothetical protein